MNSFVRFVWSGVLTVLATTTAQTLLAQADNYGPGATSRKQESNAQMHFVGQTFASQLKSFAPASFVVE
jgi:hypothetical protein